MLTSAGSPMPLGATHRPEGINFAVFSRNATQVTLVLGRHDGKRGDPVEISLDPHFNKTGDIWHIQVNGLDRGMEYGYRVKGPWDPEGRGHRYEESLVLLDPYAKALRPSKWGERRTYLGREPCCRVPWGKYDWEDDRPLKIPLRDTIIYELHVRGFTRHLTSHVKYPGSYAGLVEKIPYLKQLGITAVELMPVTEFDETDNVFFNPVTGERLRNYWGYNPLGFFAVKSAYASGGAEPLGEFRDMVKALHRAGIEVIIDMVFNHSAEGGRQGLTTSFRGIDNCIYYLLDPLTRDYLNFSGCGNTLNCNHPVVRSLILDALRWWVVEMHVDGFRFDLASILGRDQQGQVLANPPVVERIVEDPILADSKMIAEAWDAAGLYQVGSFSSHFRWAEWNGRFRDDVRSFMRGDPGRAADLATRISGNSDLYQFSGRRPCNSINFVSSHDGFTLSDLVAYDGKHNHENGENNQDGDNHNLSWNSGAEGRSGARGVQALRRRRIRSMAVILLLAQGVPMLVAGDEVDRSQGGNNNAYCQDNETSWLDWRLVESRHGQLRFFKKLIELRRRHALFRRGDFFVDQGGGYGDDHPEIAWQALHPGAVDWSPEAHVLAMTLNGSPVEGKGDGSFFLMFNGRRFDPAVFEVPAPPGGEKRPWRRIIQTSAPSPQDIVDWREAPVVEAGGEIKVRPLGCVVLFSPPISQGKVRE